MTSRAVAILGIGSIGARHLKVLGRVDGIVPIAVSRRRDCLSRLAEEGYKTANDLAAAAEMGADICVIATETAKHLEDGLDAARTGFDFLVEKPLGANASEAEEVCKAAAAANRRVFVGCTLRFSESLNAFRNMLASIGKVHSVRVECQSFLPDWRPGRSYQDSYSSGRAGGVLRDLIHEIDYTGWIFGWPHAVQARLRNLGRFGIAAEETADLMWEIPDGPVLSMTLDYVTRPARRSMTAAGESGTIEWNGIEGTVTLQFHDGVVKTVASSESRDEMLQKQDVSFIQASGGALDPRLAIGADGVRALAICDAARIASEAHREEEVRYV